MRKHSFFSFAGLSGAASGVAGAASLTFCALVAGCGSGHIDVDASRGGSVYHFERADCAVRYTGRGLENAPLAVDIACPSMLQPKPGMAALHLSVPLTIVDPTVQLQDERFGGSGNSPGAFVVVTTNNAGQMVTCDPKQAQGNVKYTALPRAGGIDRLAGSFSMDAALLSCSDGGAPIKLSGNFDVLTPAE